MNISYEEIGQVLVTCQAAEGVGEGAVVKMGEDGKTAPCTAGERFCGQCLSVAEDGYAGVQVGGFVTVACADAGVKPGWVKLTANGTGGVKKAGTDEDGQDLLVMGSDGENAVLRL